MAAIQVLKSLESVTPPKSICARLIHQTLPLCAVQAGKYKRTKHRTKPLTYEQAQQPRHIAHRKTWNSWNTTTLENGFLISQTLINDLFIRKFLIGTLPKLILSEIIIKRQHNIIRISFIVQRRLLTRKFAFLFGYIEEMLGYQLQCPVKLEPQFVTDDKIVVFQYV